MAGRFTTTITKEGPFFRNSPVLTFRQNVRKMMAAVAAEGAADVVGQMQVGESGRVPISRGIQPARVSGHVVGRVAGISGKPWAVTAKVSALGAGLSRTDAIALHAAAATIERRDHPFRRTAGRLRRSRAVNQAELLKGLQ